MLKKQQSLLLFLLADTSAQARSTPTGEGADNENPSLSWEHICCFWFQEWSSFLSKFAYSISSYVTSMEPELCSAKISMACQDKLGEAQHAQHVYGT